MLFNSAFETRNLYVSFCFQMCLELFLFSYPSLSFYLCMLSVYLSHTFMSRSMFSHSMFVILYLHVRYFIFCCLELFLFSYPSLSFHLYMLSVYGYLTCCRILYFPFHVFNPLLHTVFLNILQFLVITFISSLNVYLVTFSSLLSLPLMAR